MSDQLLYALVRSFLFSLDPETAHNLTMPALKGSAACGLTKLIAPPLPDPRTVMGITFPNPVGLAAGLDKDGAYIDVYMMSLLFIDYPVTSTQADV